MFNCKNINCDLLRALIVALLFLLPAAAKPQTVADNGRGSSTAAEIDEAVELALKAGKMPGAVVLIGDMDGTLYRKAFGSRALVPEKEPMTADTLFDLASLTKPLATATSVMRLVEKGKLRLSDKVGQFIPEIEDETAKKITIRQLLTHVSGYAPDFDLREKWSKREGMLNALYKEKLRSPPGTRFVYSDIGFIVLGEIVQRVSGEPLDKFAEEAFAEMGMNSTGFKPLERSGSSTELIAPTENISGQQNYLGSKYEGGVEEGKAILRGFVHDPTAFRMGGVGGHAGLFSTADDLARFCRMLLNEGTIGGKRILSPYTVALMTSPVVVSGDGDSRGLGWDIDTRFSSNRGALFPLGSYGHTGFTGTGIWIDPVSRIFVVFLSNRVHPDGKGDIAEVRAAISTIAAAAFAKAGPDKYSEFEADYRAKISAQIPAFVALNRRLAPVAPRNAEVLNGIDVLEAEKFARLEGMKIGLVTNHTGRDRAGRSTIDTLFEAKNVRLAALFSPEHGIRGELDRENIGDSKDKKTGLPIYSLYGASRRPTSEQLSGLDALAFDIQDVGTRFYTYISTLRYVMEEASKAKIPVYVFDRPNPINGVAIEGAIADEGSLSFTAAHTIPVRHGMTVGELALMMNAERKIGADVRVVRMQGWRRSMWFDETGQTWVDPSPNMRSLTEATLYPGIGLLETTNLSVGRGTDTPFEVVGAPWMDGRAVASYLNRRAIRGARFVPVEFIPDASVFKGEKCSGVNIIITDRSVFESVRTGTEIALTLRALYPDVWNFSAYDRLLSDPRSSTLIRLNSTSSSFVDLWRSDRDAFSRRRAIFLLYN